MNSSRSDLPPIHAMFPAPSIETRINKPLLAPLPRLRIHHILLWTAVTAGWLTFARLLSDGIPTEQSIVQLNLLVIAVLYGAATTITGLGIFWRARGLAFFTQPGHWLACWFMLGILWSIIVNFLLYWQSQAATNGNMWERADESWLLWLLFYPWIRLVVVGTCMLVLAVWAADALAWRVFFIGWAICGCLPAVVGAVGWARRLESTGLLQWWLLFFDLVPAVLLAFAGLNDYRKRRVRRRHWSHWAGVLVAGALMSFQVVMMLWFWLTPPQP